MNLNDILSDYKPYIEIKDCILKNKFPINVSGICNSAEGHFVSAVSKVDTERSVVVCYTDIEAAELYKEIRFYTDKVFRFPSKELTIYNVDAVGSEVTTRRIRALYEWENGGILVTSVDAIYGYTLPKKYFDSLRINFKVGNVCDFQEITKNLVKIGYTQSDEVDGVGLFSVRGGIIDVFSPNYKLPVRIEFFDDEVDSIRFFDWETQRSTDNADSVVIVPTSEAIMDEDERKRLIDKLKKLNELHPENDDISSELDKAIDNQIFPSIDKYINSAYGCIPNLTDYFGESKIFVIDPNRIKDRLENYVADKTDIMADFIESNDIVSDFSDLYCDKNLIFDKLFNLKAIFVNPFDTNKSSIDFKSRQTISFHGKVDYLYDSVDAWTKDDYTIVILAQSEDKAKNLLGVLKEKGYDCIISKDSISPKKVNIGIGHIKSGFEYPDFKFVLISDKEIFESEIRKTRRKISNDKRIKSYNDISVGDFVVHQVHGIGVYNGLHKMTVNGISKDYLKVSYKDNDTLYIPVEQLDVLFKYSGSDAENVKISKLGTKEWKKTKQKVKKSTDDMARQLVNLYAQRQNTKGYAYSKDTVWQRDFEDSFVYTETEDQLRSIEEVKADMESDKPMDRLLCGDVGFGKTEVALRAAFKAIMDGKQVAYLCPTTILAMQHYNTFSDRMKDFPINVEMLSRFRTPNQQKKILKDLKAGKIEVLIGTHRILQKDVEFKDLGLLIIDEEQRFGVSHKEKLKVLKNNIDVLSMTATPIPRTLHMSMISVRDMSVLTHPPQNRYPIQTYVLENNPSVIIDAIRKELARGGQVFYLHNRIQGLSRIANFIQENFPDKTVRVGNGQMDERQLEDIMQDMVSGDIDVLVCTTIIETGLDIPNANTIIIDNADKMGLAQLYQLRGRVGRSNKKAYAYLVYNKDKVISEVAQKRLQAIKEFTEFGSGFKIALKDLEIRGAGDILGSSQHGHMDSVGYDLYCKILKQSINEIQGKKAEDEEVSTSVDISIDAYIPDKYISNSNFRIDMYKKISAIQTEEDVSEIEDEMTDRFGDIPRSARNVITVAYLRSLASKIGITEIVQRENYVNIKFNDTDISKLMSLVSSNMKKYKLIPDEHPHIRITLESKAKVLEECTKVIDELSD